MLNDLYFRVSTQGPRLFEIWWPLRELESVSSYVSITGRNLEFPLGRIPSEPDLNFIYNAFKDQTKNLSMLRGTVSVKVAEKIRLEDNNPWCNLGGTSSYLPSVYLVKSKKLLVPLIDVPTEDLPLGKLNVLRFNASSHAPVLGAIHGSNSVIWS